MKLRNFLPLLLVTLLMAGLIGCQPTEQAGGQADSQAGGAPNVSDPVKLIWLMGNPGTVPKEKAKVEEALAEITVPKVGAYVDTLYLDNEQIKLSLNSGEYFDIAFTCEWYNNYAVQAAAGFFADITEMVKTAAPELYSFIPETVWKGSAVDGKVYAVPVYKDTAATQYWQFDKEFVIDELGLDIGKYTSFDSVEEVLRLAKEARPDDYPMWLAQSFNAIDSHFDMINRDIAIGVSYQKRDNKVVVTYDTEEFKARLRKLHEWFKAGYINPDAATTESAALPKRMAVKTGQGFPGAEAIWSSGGGYQVEITPWYGPVLSTSSIRGAMNAVGAGSSHKELALQYLQLVNTDRATRDTLRYGIEGEHYDYVNDGKSVKVLSDAYEPWGFSQGTFFVMTPEDPVTAETWDEVRAINDKAAADADPSTLGFSFDIENVQAEVAACQNIVEKYKKGLLTGTTDPDVECPKLVSELMSAGMDTILTECQEQLDAFIAASR